MWVDVVTAVHAAYASFLPAAYASLRAQTHPSWRWLVQIDGVNDSAVRTVLELTGAADDDRVLVDSNRDLTGPAITRNIAAARAEAPLLQNLDADDLLEADAIGLLVSAMRAHPAAGFAVGHARDLLPDGSLREHELSLAPGVLARGTLSDAWLNDPGNDRLPVHPAGAMWRRALVVELGGWTALHGMEDTGLLMAASAVAEGVLVDAPTLRYRKHPRQRSIRTKESKFAGGGAHISLVRQRVEILAAGPGWSGSGRGDHHRAVAHREAAADFVDRGGEAGQ
ncbi:glycosyltransferase family A protein [Amycolatopsis sp. GM8]|uniref:glycosyltransferase family 2 protein n=1 Tax=Amycolatopsis sp. GM8 TaxID=2896530 RepID=UPI001F2D160D|nr:glycosyltransferase family A protein [Amycolatopsis sp. GM8]